MENESINLTEAEVELIRIKREEEKLKAEKQAVEETLKLNKEIQEKQEWIAKQIKQSEAKASATLKFFKQFNQFGGYELKSTEKVNPAKISKYLGDGKYDVKWESSYKTTEYVIWHSDGKHCITAEEHIVYPSWSSRGTNKGWKMNPHGYAFPTNRMYMNAKTVHEKITNYNDAVKAKAIAELLNKESAEYQINKLKANFPDADVKKTLVSYSTGYTGYGNRDRYKTLEVIQVTFSNGVIVELTFNTKGVNWVRNISIPTHEKDINSVLSELNKLNIQ